MNQDTPRGDWGRHSTSSGGLIRCPFPKGPSAQGHSVASRRQLAPSVSLYSQGADGTAERRGPMQMGWLEHMALKFAPALCRAAVFQGCLYFQKLRGRQQEVWSPLTLRLGQFGYPAGHSCQRTVVAARPTVSTHRHLSHARHMPRGLGTYSAGGTVTPAAVCLSPQD